MRWLPLTLAAFASLQSLHLSAQDDIQITKYRRFVQSSTAAPVAEAGNSYRFSFVGAGLGVASATVTLTPPSGTVINVPIVGMHRVFTASAASAAALNSTYGSGPYTLSVGIAGFALETTVNFGADGYPPAPSLVNFTAAQAIDVTGDFLLDWAPFAGGTGDDFILLRVLNSSAIAVYEDTLDGTAGDYLLPAETLAAGQTYSLELTFMAIDERAESEDGLSLTSAFASLTTLPIKTTGSGGGGDRIPPTLVSASPASSQALGTVQTPLVLTFSEPMDTSRTPVLWTALSNGVNVVLSPAKFSYNWTAGGTILACAYDTAGAGWPTSTFVTWTLSGSDVGFRDVAGNPLTSTGGFFQTPSGGVIPCDDEDPAERSGFGIFKFSPYFQTSAATPGADPTNRPLFQAFATLTNSGGRPAVEFPAAPAPQPHRVLSLTGPIPGSAFFFETHPTEAALDTAFPGGQYDFQVRSTTDNTTVLNHVVLNLPNQGYPAIPHFSNFAAAQAINPTNAFTLSWDAFAGASTSTDYLALEIWDEAEEVVLSLPEPCLDRPLAVTATSTTLPGGLLQPGRTYMAILSFMKLQDSNKTLPGSPATGITATSRTTRMLLRTTGGSGVTAPVLRDLFVNGANQLDITIDATVGRPFTLERSSTLGGAFSPVTTTTPASSPFHLQVPLAEQGFFRGRTD
jgi:hypothetical protein